MNNRQLKKKYKKLYNYDFLYNGIKKWYGEEYFTLKIAFYDVKEKNIGLIINNHNHGYFDCIDKTFYF